MKRRGFLKHLMVIAGAVCLPTTILNYDPVKRVIVNKPTPDVSMLTGYKGDRVLEVGYVYGPYIPIFRTPNLQKI